MTDNKICPICEKKVDCEYFNKYDHPACCPCDVPTEKEKWCASDISGYASDVYDEVKGQKERELL